MIRRLDSQGDNTSTPSSFQLVCVLSLLSYFYISNEISKRPTLKWVPESAVIIVIGLVAILMTSQTEVPSFKFPTELFFRVLLTPIIFASGFKMNLKVFYDNLSTILWFANIGTIVNILIFAVIMYGLGVCGLSTRLTLAEAMSFGSVISATDPVTTVAIFDHLQVESALYVIVVAVSVLDDAVSIIMFNMFNALTTTEGTAVNHTTQYYVTSFIWQFVVIFAGSVAIGYTLGLVFAFTIRRRTEITDNAVNFHMMIIASAYLAYMSADALSLSGITAVMFAGISMQRHLALFASPAQMEGATHSVSLLAQAFETIVFFLMGSSLLQNTASSGSDWGFIAWSVLMCLLTRAIQVYPLAMMINHYNKPAACAKFTAISTEDQGMSDESIRGGVNVSSERGGQQQQIELLTLSTRGVGDVESGRMQGQQKEQSMDDESIHRGRSNSTTHLVASGGAHEAIKRPTANQLSFGYQHVMLVAGLRGPISYATGKLFPDALGHNNLVAAASSVIVLVTILFLGPLTIPTLKYCGIKFGGEAANSSEDNEEDENNSTEHGAQREVANTLRTSSSAAVHSQFVAGESEALPDSTPFYHPKRLLITFCEMFHCGAVWRWIEKTDASVIKPLFGPVAEGSMTNGDDSLLADCFGSTHGRDDVDVQGNSLVDRTHPKQQQMLQQQNPLHSSSEMTREVQSVSSSSSSSSTSSAGVVSSGVTLNKDDSSAAAGGQNLKPVFKPPPAVLPLTVKTAGTSSRKDGVKSTRRDEDFSRILNMVQDSIHMSEALEMEEIRNKSTGRSSISGGGRRSSSSGSGSD